MKRLMSVLLGFLVLSGISPSVFASELPKNINVNIGFGIQSENNEPHNDSVGGTLGKIVGTAAFATATGGAMAGSLPLIKNTEALFSPLSFMVISGALLVTQWHVIKKAFGPNYTDFATWFSTATMVAFGCKILAMKNKIAHRPDDKGVKA